jgi:hypothetical protein
MKMTVLCMKETGHVLAAVTRVAETAAAATAADMTEDAKQALEAKRVAELAGDALMVRYVRDDSKSFSSAEFSVPADELRAVMTDLDTSVLLDPRDYACDTEGQLHPLSPNQLDSAELDAQRNSLTVTLKNPVTEQTWVWAQFTPDESGNRQTTAFESVKSGEKSVTFTLRQVPGEVDGVLVVAGGCVPSVFNTSTA